MYIIHKDEMHTASKVIQQYYINTIKTHCYIYSYSIEGLIEIFWLNFPCYSRKAQLSLQYYKYYIMLHNSCCLTHSPPRMSLLYCATFHLCEQALSSYKRNLEQVHVVHQFSSLYIHFWKRTEGWKNGVRAA